MSYEYDVNGCAIVGTLVGYLNFTGQQLMNKLINNNGQGNVQGNCEAQDNRELRRTPIRSNAVVQEPLGFLRRFRQTQRLAHRHC